MITITIQTKGREETKSPKTYCYAETSEHYSPHKFPLSLWSPVITINYNQEAGPASETS